MFALSPRTVYSLGSASAPPHPNLVHHRCEPTALQALMLEGLLHLNLYTPGLRGAQHVRSRSAGDHYRDFPRREGFRLDLGLSRTAQNEAVSPARGLVLGCKFSCESPRV